MRLRPLGNTRGSHLQLIANNFFYIMMLIFATVIIMNSMKSTNIAYEYRMENMRFNNYAARIMYSSDCLAHVGSYSTELGSRMRVYPAVLDVGKMRADKLNKCLVGLDEKDDFELAIAEIGDEIVLANDTAGNTTGGSGEATTGSAVDNTSNTSASESGGNESAVVEDSCASNNYTCIDKLATCKGKRVFAYDDTCAEGYLCCDGEAVEAAEFANLTIGKTYYSSRKASGEMDYNSACKAIMRTESFKVPGFFGSLKKGTKTGWDRTATFFVEIEDGGEVKRGVLKFCYYE